MDFTLSPKVVQLQKRVSDFMNAHVYPIEKRVEDEMNVHGKEHIEPRNSQGGPQEGQGGGPVEPLPARRALRQGAQGGRVRAAVRNHGPQPIGSRAFNCMAPDTGNMEILAEFGTAEQKKRWLEPCLEGEMRTCFSMTEPETAGSDPTQLGDARGARRRLLRDQRAQVVHLGRDRRVRSRSRWW